MYTRQQRASWLRGELLHDQLHHLRSLRRKARRALLEESRKQTVAARLREIPGLGPLRVALLIAGVQTPQRFRSRRNFWTYACLGLVRRGSAEYGLVEGRVVRCARAVNPRGLNPHHRPELKQLFKSAALTAIRCPGPCWHAVQVLVKQNLKKRASGEKMQMAQTAFELKAGDATPVPDTPQDISVGGRLHDHYSQQPFLAHRHPQG